MSKQETAQEVRGKAVKRPNRYDFAKAVWGEKLLAWHKAHLEHDADDTTALAMGRDIDSIFEAVASYDITQNSASRYKFLFWLCKVIVQDNIKPEDIYKIKEDLETFSSVRNRLPKDKRDIRQIRTACDLQTIVLPYQQGEIVSLSQLKQEERQQILNETLFLYEGEDGKILIPITQRAAQFWGQGTKWCVSSTDPEWLHHFPNYNKKGPLLIYITNETATDPETNITYQVKYAGHRQDGYLRDARDKAVLTKIPTIIKMLEQSNQATFCMKYGCITPVHYPPNTFDEDFLLDYIKNGGKFQNIHEEERTEKIYLVEVQQSRLTLKTVPQDKRTEAICLVAVQRIAVQNARVLEDVPQDKFSDEVYEKICIAAVQQNGWALNHVPQDKLSDEVYEKICIAAVQQNGWVLQHVPRDKRTEAICLVAVQRNEWTLNHVPQDKFSDEVYEKICLVAVQQNGWVLKDVPQDKFSDEVYEKICIAAVQQNGWVLKGVPQDKLSDEVYEKICIAAVQQNARTLNHVPQDKLSDEVYEKICIAAVQEWGGALQYVPLGKRTEKMKRIVLHQVLSANNVEVKNKKDLIQYFALEEFLNNKQRAELGFSAVSQHPQQRSMALTP